MTKASSEPLISVIVPVYKVEEYLDECVASIVNQTYTNLEIILVDDGSPDNCPRLCDEWAGRDKRIKVVHKENGGVCSARNSGLDIVQGEWISFVDSDDWIEPTYIQEMYKKVIEANAKYICCGYNKVYRNTIQQINANGEVVEFTKKEFIKALLNVENSYGFVHMKLINKDIFEKVRFNESLTVGEDALLNIGLVEKVDKLVVYNKPLYNYRINLNSVVRKFDNNYVNKYTDSMLVMTKYINKKYRDNEKIRVDLANYIVYHLMLICVNYCYNPENKNKYKSLKEVCRIKVYKEAITKCEYKNFSLSRKITLLTIKHHLYFLTAMICKVRQKQIRR